jgi:large subunit ribosomal protein L32
VGRKEGFIDEIGDFRYNYCTLTRLINSPFGFASAFAKATADKQGKFFKETFMGVPKKHKTRSGRDQRRSHHALKATSFATCKNCGNATMPHLPCKNCGYYKGKKVTK